MCASSSSPKTRNVDAEMLMEQLFRLTELEVRVPLTSMCSIRSASRG